MKKHEEFAMKCTRFVCLLGVLLIASAAWAGLYDAPYEMRFTTWTTNLESWTNYGTGNYTTGYLVANSVKFDTQGDSLESPTIDNPDTVRMWMRAATGGTLTPGIFKIYAKQGTNAYSMIHECTWGPGNDLQNNAYAQLVLPLDASYRGQEDVKFKWVYELKYSGTNVGLDSFTVSAYSGGGDTTPPSISSITVIDNTHLDVLFSENVDQTTAETESNYVVTPGSVNPSLATRDGTNNALVHLTFASALTIGTDTLTVNGVQDLSTNACTNATGTFVIAVVVNVGDVLINEVMYDDTATADSEWVELHNTTGSAIDVGGWYLTDDDSYPTLSGEGGITIPTGTSIPADGYLVISKATVPDLTGVVVCTQAGSFALGNSGDNLALYTAATGGTLIDGSLSVYYPDLTTTQGYSIEKCDENAAWDGSASAWHASTNLYGTGRTLYGTPGATNSICVDLTPPSIVSVTVNSDTQLDVLFSEPVDQTTAETEANYTVTVGNINPSSALRDGSNISLVHLTFASSLPVGTDTLWVNAVEDTSSNNNACSNIWRTFVITGGDVTPPSIISVTPLSKMLLDVLFSEPVDLTTAETEANYTVLPGSINPSSALRDATNLALVHLTFASNLPAGTDTLNVNAVEDTSSNNNACVNVQKTFRIPLAEEGDVVINEIMYDDTASTDVEWVELYNRTASAVDISGWVVIDAATYPATGSEGGFYLPASTSIAAGGYLVVAKAALDGITGEVVGTQYFGSWTLGNSGDNLALYTDTVGGLRIDGYATTDVLYFYPDWATANAGTTLEKCIEDSPWPADSTGWHASTNAYATTGRYRFCTPGATNTACVGDTVRPTLVSATVITNTTVDVQFSETVEETTAETVTNYSVDNGIGNPSTATRQTNPLIVRLVFASALAPNTYVLTVNNVTDLASNVILPNSTTGFTVSASAYSIYVTEVMPNPAIVADASGEWFEIYNAGASAVDMTGWDITDTEGTFTMTSGTIAAGGYFVFCVNADSATNGGVPEDYVYPYANTTGLQLSNTADDITLKDASDNIVASIAYTTAFPWGAGYSMQLKNIAYNPAFDTSWCAAVSAWTGSMGDFGTPGLATNCGAPFIPDTISICSLRVEDTCGVPLRNHVRQVTRGVFSYVDTCKATGYLQSDCCGVAVYGGCLFDSMQGVDRYPRTGDSVMIDGYISQFRGLTEIQTYGGWTPVITLLDSDLTVTPVDIACTDIGLLAAACVGEDFESEMIRIPNVFFINAADTFAMADSNYAVLCGTDTIYFRTDSCDVALIGTTIPTGQIHITGILGQYDSVDCACQGYQIVYGGVTAFAPAQCAEPESLTVIRDGITDNVVLHWKPGLNQTCNCYEIYWTANATNVFPTGYNYLANVIGSTTYTDNSGLAAIRFYRVTAGGPHCP
jgi:hypothetical protein